jgi:hypothetical protein
MTPFKSFSYSSTQTYHTITVVPHLTMLEGVILGSKVG